MRLLNLLGDVMGSLMGFAYNVPDLIQEELLDSDEKFQDCFLAVHDIVYLRLMTMVLSYNGLLFPQGLAWLASSCWEGSGSAAVTQLCRYSFTRQKSISQPLLSRLCCDVCSTT